MNPRAIAGALVAAAFVLPGRQLDDGAITCAFRQLTGRPCPACGLTRSWRAAAHGRPRESMAYHPFGLATMAGATWFAMDPDAGVRLASVDRRVVGLAVGAWFASWLWRLRRA